MARLGKWGRCLSALGALTASLVTTQRAGAQDAFDFATPTSSPPAPQGTEQALVSRYWELGRPRWFFGTTLEGGYAYVKPRFSVGYGLPYWRWFGIEADPMLALSSVGQYLGISAALPGVTARLGARYVYSFKRSFLTPRDSFDWTDLEVQTGPTADYLALESELTGTVPVPGGSAFSVLNFYRTELVPDGYYLFEESLRVVMEPPYVWRARLGYLLAFGRDGAIRIGAAGDVIGIPGRDELVIRGGLLASVSMTAHLEAQASFIPVLVSPDEIGLAGGDFGQLGVRFRWATGSTPDVQRLREAFPRPQPR
jgi:hypothetical protein